MKTHEIDVPVLLIFWARDEQFAQVFEQVRNARPRQLFLYQDGPRKDQPGDIESIQRCRTIAETIDWNCEVQRFYQEQNVGCDPSEFIAIKWAFDHVDRCIILEDDDVPSQSFFPFCKEMLERYNDDKRMHIICGMNNLGVSTECPYDYFFASTGSIWGWATWKRNVDLWEEHYDFLDDPYSSPLVEAIVGKRYMNAYKRHRDTGRAHYESIMGSSCFLNSRLCIIPKQNMISNIGVCENTTHGASSIDMVPKGIRSVFHAKAYDIEFPLNHPKYVVDDVNYKKQLDRLMGNGHPWVQIYRQCESIIRRCIACDFASLAKGMRRRLSR
jgi:hypothetical protein